MLLLPFLLQNAREHISLFALTLRVITGLWIWSMRIQMSSTPFDFPMMIKPGREGDHVAHVRYASEQEEVKIGSSQPYPIKTE